ncbi:MAG: hypothetical protein Q7S32_01680, partial [bacterium]|nr:hypothetical protein [bacterium]
RSNSLTCGSEVLRKSRSRHASAFLISQYIKIEKTLLLLCLPCDSQSFKGSKIQTGTKESQS